MGNQIKIPEKLFNELAEIARNPEAYKEDMSRNTKGFDEDISEYVYVICGNCGALTKYNEFINKYNRFCPNCNTYIEHLSIR